jgi:hypothetical protein
MRGAEQEKRAEEERELALHEQEREVYGRSMQCKRGNARQN